MLSSASLRYQDWPRASQQRSLYVTDAPKRNAGISNVPNRFEEGRRHSVGA